MKNIKTFKEFVLENDFGGGGAYATLDSIPTQGPISVGADGVTTGDITMYPDGRKKKKKKKPDYFYDNSDIDNVVHKLMKNEDVDEWEIIKNDKETETEE